MSLVTQRDNAQARLAEIIDEIEGVGASAEAAGRQLDENDNKILASLQDESAQLETSIKTLNGAIQSAERAKAARMPAPSSAVPGEPNSLITSGPAASLPARVRRFKSKVFESNADAYGCGRWLQATIGGSRAARQWCQENGWLRNDMQIGDDTLGGYAVPSPLAAEILRLVEEYGVYRRYSRPIIMGSSTLDVAKITGHTTVYYPAEGADITASDLNLGNVQLLARKYASQTLLSREVEEDAVSSLVDQVAIDMAWNFARAEDINSFLGDGTGTYGGITGISAALQAGANVSASGGVTLATLEQMLGKLPQYPGIRPRWFMHSWTYHTIVVPALVALGGTDMRQTEAGGELMLYGYPVTFTQALPGAAQTTGDMPVVLGDLGLGSFNGTRRNFEVRQLNELYASTDQIGVICTMRADSVIHSVGDATDAGAIVKSTIAA